MLFIGLPQKDIKKDQFRVVQNKKNQPRAFNDVLNFSLHKYLDCYVISEVKNLGETC